MSQIKPSHIIFTAILALALGGCGDKNSASVFGPESGHPVGWTATHKTVAKVNSGPCKSCHGDDFRGGIAKVACTKCHTNGAPVGAAASDCTSCHGAPPNGTTFPNMKLSHDSHDTLATVTCDTCHKGFGYNTPAHGMLDDARLSITSDFRARSAVADPTYEYNPARDVTCKNVSCHGGKDTPLWGVAITDCATCHSLGTGRYTPEYNSYYSGYVAAGLDDVTGTNQHDRHLKRGFTCNDCHATWKLTKQQHYGGIATKTFTSPGNTIGGDGTRIGSYDTTTQTCSFVACHTKVPTSVPWYRY